MARESDIFQRKVYKPRSDIELISAARSSDLLTGGDRAIVGSRMESVLRFGVANRGIWAFQADAKRSVSTCLQLSGTPLIKASNRLSLKMSETLRQQLCYLGGDVRKRLRMGSSAFVNICDGGGKLSKKRWIEMLADEAVKL
ncbi:Uncharacterized protein APZ42_026604 [Daphnia magna]|uniref:Uncharacterized protein n=1 Tax=Daphnia magna TaxID=35525 RepID=A0A164S497_9CRUS|nr:Uncharacterized protein APZ42_026604 [Daphnia magna]